MYKLGNTYQAFSIEDARVKPHLKKMVQLKQATIDLSVYIL